MTLASDRPALLCREDEGDGGHPASDPSVPPGQPVGRRVLWLLAAWALAWFAVLEIHGGYSWHYFAHGSALLFGAHPGGLTRPGGLHIYTSYPKYQIGPPAFVVAAVLAPFGLLGAQLFMLALGGVVLVTVVRTAALVGRTLSGFQLALGVALFIPLWMELAVHYSHLDDVLALTCAALAARAVATGSRWAGLLLGLSVAAKPWAAAFLPLLWALPATRRRAALGAAILLPVLVWLPFVIADPATVTATGQFTIVNASDSALRVLGVHAARTPSWCRPAQLLFGIVAGAAAIRRGRWAAAILAAVAIRLLLDPGTYAYYTAGALTAALLTDLALARRSWPVTSLLTFAGLYIPSLVGAAAHARGEIRATTCIALLVLAICGRRPAHDQRRIVPYGDGEQAFDRHDADRLRSRDLVGMQLHRATGLTRTARDLPSDASAMKVSGHAVEKSHSGRNLSAASNACMTTIARAAVPYAVRAAGRTRCPASSRSTHASLAVGVPAVTTSMKRAIG